MYPFFRLAALSLKALRAPKQTFDSIGTCTFRAHPWDIDMFMEMNNGRHLTLYDLGRFDLAIKCGLTKVLQQKKWGLVVAGSSVRFRRRIRMFEKVTMKSQLIGFETRWFYFQQVMYVRGQPCSAVLMRTAVTEGGKTIDASRVAEAMGIPDRQVLLPDWASKWIDADADRPWPPEFVE